MVVADAKFARIRGGKPFYAEVAVEVESLSQAPGIEFRCSGRGFVMQGYVEDVPAVGYDVWKGGAQAGAVFALAVAKARSARVVVTRISGLTTDTNPSVVGAATALAVWRALCFEPPAEVIARLESIVFSSWERPPNEVPQFAKQDGVL
jgi:hypothetical protein